jgi:pimeloyl-ACP methyl ester carboxylesterase
MSFTGEGGARLYWETSGAGSPLLLIQGLGYSAEMWYRLIPALEQKHEVVRYDGRGIGRSDVPPGPYPVDVMAADAIAILDAAGIDTAHVLGVSLGGVVAQEVALSYPERVRSLLLGCTHTAGEAAVWPGPEVLDLLRSRATMPFDEAVRAAVDHAYGCAPPEAIEEDIRRRLAIPTAAEGYAAQLLSGLGYGGTAERLHQIDVPTLVFTGDRDMLVPPENSELLAKAIRGAELVVIKGAGHVVFTDNPAAVCNAVNGFLDSIGSDELVH